MGGLSLRAMAAFGLVSLLACGGGDDEADPESTSSSSGGGTSSGGPGDSTSVTFGGTAAVGAPIANASVTAQCSDGQTYTATTSAAGTWTNTVPPRALPCALQITGPTGPLHGFASAAGVANLTPLTDLAIALAAQRLPAEWFATADPALVAANLAAAIDTLKNALVASGFTLPPGAFAPFTVAFQAAPGDPWDDLLEAIAAALATRPGGYAGLVAQFATGNSTLPPSGNDDVLAGRNGVTGRFGTTTYTFVDNVAFSGALHVMSAHGEDGHGGWDPLTRWLISGLPTQPGTYACKSDAQQVLPKIELQVGGVYYGTPPTGGECSITITSVAGDEIVGSFRAKLVDQNGVSGEVTEGAFRQLHDDDMGGQPLGPSEAGASFVVNGKRYRYDQAHSLAYETFAGALLQPSSPTSPGSPLGIQLHSVPNATGTYACDTGDPYRKLNVWFAWHGEVYTAGNRASPTAGPAGSSCSLTVEHAGMLAGSEILGTFDGTFSGTFVSSDGQRQVVVSEGSFRYVGAAEPAIEPKLAPMVGTQVPKVLSGAFSFGTTLGADLPITIDPDGAVHVGAIYTFTEYSFIDNNAEGSAEPSYRLATVDNQHRLYLFMEHETPVAYRYEAEAGQLVAAFRPISQAMLDAMTKLAALRDTTMTRVAGGACATLTVTGSATLSLTDPYLQLTFPALVTDTWADSSARLFSEAGTPALYTYYSKYLFPAPGVVDLHPLGGNHQDYGEVWTNDPAKIAAACP